MQTTITFSNLEQVTSGKLNQITSGLSFTTSDIVGSTLSVVGGKLKVGVITASEMGALSVSNGSLQDGCVTTSKLANFSVGFFQLGVNAVGYDRIADDSVYFSKINSVSIATQSNMENQDGGLFFTPSRAKYSPSSAKAYGEFNITGSGRSPKGNSFNVASIERVSTTASRVLLTENMVNENYTVIVTGISSNDEHLSCTVFDKVAGSFKIRHTPEGAGRAINFSVFGKHA